MPLFSTVVARKENDVPRVSFLRVPDCGSFHVTLWGTGALATFLSAYFVYLFYSRRMGESKIYSFHATFTQDEISNTYLVPNSITYS